MGALSLSKAARRSLYVLIIWTALSTVLLISYVVFANWIWQAWYYVLWPLMAGGLLWHYREPACEMVRKWPYPALLKYVLLVYAMVMAEEVLAALFNHLSEGVSWWLYLQRIGQFWAFNILAFSGMAWGGYFVFSRYKFTFAEMFCIMGLFGQYSEHLLYRLLFVPHERIAAFVLMPLNFWVYGIIFVPALWVLKGEHAKQKRFIIRYMLAFSVIWLCSVPFIGVLMLWRESMPDVFPPRQFIP